MWDGSRMICYIRWKIYNNFTAIVLLPILTVFVIWTSMVHCRIAQKVHVDNEKDRVELNGLNTLNVFFLWSVKVCEHNGFIDFSLRVPRLSICLQRLWRNSPGGFTPSTWCGSRGTRSPRPSPMSLNRCGFISAHRFMVIVVLIKVFILTTLLFP